MQNCALLSSWNNYLSLFPSNKCDIYFTESYVNLNKGDGVAECFLYQENEHIWLFPYIKKMITCDDINYWDFESQYGYGGPISNCDEYSFLKNAQIEFSNFMKNESFIAGLVRFHPLLNNHILLDNCAKLFFNRHTVGVDLTQEIETIWKEQIHSKHRNSIRKAEKSGLEYFVDYEFKYYDEFKVLYKQTMKRNYADKFYFFNDSYFESLKDKFSGTSFLAHVKLEGEIIGSSIFFYSNNYAHYHLSGSNINFLSLNSNCFLLFKTIEHFKKMNRKIFHLGGGTDSSLNNSLYRFKERFSNQRYDFFMGEIIFNKTIYNRICQSWIEANPDKAISNHNKLLKYRF